MSAQQFTLGSKVRLKAEPTEVGVVTAANAYSGGWTYTVFFKGLGDQQVTEGALEQVLQPREIQVVSRKAFLRTLLLTKLDNPLNDHFYSFQASRTAFEAYQFKPVLKFLDSPVPAILIADEVGLGKTIEAAILHQELKARGEIRRVLVICPAGLRQKWQAELLNRFDESFKLMYAREVIEDARFFRDTDGHAPLQGIVSLETYRNADVQAVLDEIKVTYDLVIIDEAHHLRSSGTLSNQVGERAQEMSDHLVLLTATPLQTSQQDLFNLLRFLDPAQFSDFDDFLLQLAPNALLNEAIRHLREDPPDLLSARMALGRITSLAAAGQVTSHPTYPLVMKALDTGRLEREELVRLRRDIDSLNMLSAIYTRTKKGDVSRVARRKAFALKVQATDQEQEFLAAVLAHARAQARARSGSGWAPAFAGIMRERQAASCITAMREYLEEGMKLKAGSGSAPVLGVEQSATELDALDPTGGDERPGDVAQQLAVAARALGKQDSKFDLFSRTLTDLLRESPDSKVLVFTFFRRTLSYLVRRLKSQGIPVVEIHGGVPPDERAIRIANFREGQDVRVLVTTEVGSEGLDFQFCDTIFNYDLPWNPMRVEQRIGRIDRYGQQKDQVRIYSM
jgi:SNF2 family DNA or RNA helicase